MFIFFIIFPISFAAWKFAYNDSGCQGDIFVMIDSLNFFYLFVLTIHLALQILGSLPCQIIQIDHIVGLLVLLKFE